MKYGKLIAVGLLATVGFSTVVNAATETISAFLKDNVTYTLNEQPILEGEKAVVYEDKIYLPLRAISEAVGLEVDYKDGQVMLTTTASVDVKEAKQAEGSDAVVEENPVIAACEIKEATIVEVDAKDNKIVVSTDATDLNNPNNQTIIYITEDTNIAHHMNKMMYTFADLVEGQKVAIQTNGQMTLSIPAQTTAKAVILLDDAEVAQPEEENPVFNDCDIKDVTIVEVNADEKTITISKQADDLNNPDNQIVVNVTEDTHIAHYKNKMRYTFADLEKGQKVYIQTTGQMTYSIPAQTTAVSVILAD